MTQAILTARPGGVSVVTKVKASSRTQKLVLMPEWLAVHVHAPALDGRANRAVLTMVGAHFGCRAALLRGETSSQKVLLLEGMAFEAAFAALHRLQRDALPDVRDGLSRIERLVLVELTRAQAEFPGRRVPTATLYGRVCEHAEVNLSVRDFEALVARLTRGPS